MESSRCALTTEFQVDLVISQSCSQSVGCARAQLKKMGGVGFLTMKTLLGNQFAAPITHECTPSRSTQTQHTQTWSGMSHICMMSSSGLLRAGSRGKAALCTTTGLCVSDDKMSPRDEHFKIISRNENHTKDAHIKATLQKHNVSVCTLPSPSVTNPLNVGLALSSLPPSVEGDFNEPLKPMYIHDHLYAQGSQSPSRCLHAHSSSDYAGPHPSVVLIATPTAALTSDMSARYHLPSPPMRCCIPMLPFQHPQVWLLHNTHLPFSLLSLPSCIKPLNQYWDHQIASLS
jgi:hypothetical protein